MRLTCFPESSDEALAPFSAAELPASKTPEPSGSRAPTRRYCPATHELIDLEDCQSCEKYRHWPAHTDEEPSECWYDWQVRVDGEDDVDSREVKGALSDCPPTGCRAVSAHRRASSP